MTTTIERPILFNGAMVRAILEGRKTQTRRVVKNLEGRPANSWTLHRAAGCADSWSSDSGWMGRCPYGQPGDRLWVREAFREALGFETEPLSFCRYKASDPLADEHKWTPSIHMPRWASRILLEITAVRVERLQDISDTDAEAEGIQEIVDAGVDHDGTPRDAYRALWEQINGAGSWSANPWVWVVEFKRAEVSA